YKIGKVNNIWEQRLKENKKIMSNQLERCIKSNFRCSKYTLQIKRRIKRRNRRKKTRQIYYKYRGSRGKKERNYSFWGFKFRLKTR
ncbi:MAG: hypothetical protein K2H53_00095, partial [Clostridia bacterium]|nr:hypothetical protein [Clostridia bacterium]